MLVLSRKTNESIHIGSDITIKILSVGKSRVTIGIIGPDNVIIRRAELKPLAESMPDTVASLARKAFVPSFKMALPELVSIS